MKRIIEKKQKHRFLRENFKEHLKKEFNTLKY